MRNNSISILDSVVYGDLLAGYASLVGTLGQNIKALREGRGMTQIELATAAKVKQGDVSSWETDKKLPSARSLIRLAVGLEKQIDDLVRGVDSNYDLIASRVQQGSRKGGAVDPVTTPRVLEEQLAFVDQVQDAVREISKAAIAIGAEARRASRVLSGRVSRARRSG